MQLIKPGQRGVEVCLVEDFAAAGQVVFDRPQRDPSPLGLEALLRSLVRRVSDDCPEVGHSMHDLDIDIDVLVTVQPGAQVCHQVNGPERCLPFGGRC